MDVADVCYYDVAAVVMTAVLLMSLVSRRLTRGPLNRVFLSAEVLLLLTAVTCLGGELYDVFIEPWLEYGSDSPSWPLGVRSGLTLAYYLLRSYSAPAYLVLIATVGGTSHLLARKRSLVLLVTPVVALDLFILANPLHHLVYHYEDVYSVRGPLIGLLYVVAAYYALAGVAWLLRWRSSMDQDEFSTLLLGYPLVLLSVIIQYCYPHLRVEMFISAVVLMLVSAFVIRPERQMDSLVDALSLHAYREASRRVFLTDKHLCLVFVEVVDMERLRELVGKDVLQDTMRQVSVQLGSHLERGDALYYLRNGLFCIFTRRADAFRACSVAREAHAEGKARALQSSGPTPRMRVCVVRLPEDVPSEAELRSFVRRFSHLVPDSRVVTFAELSRRNDFTLQMALSDVVEDAIERRRFEVFYQPIYCIADGRFHSAEALVRLHDERFGWVAPSLFVPEAEQSGAIVAIGTILLEKVCAFLSHLDYDACGLSYVEVNLSTEQCVRPHLAREILGIMESKGVDPSRMNLELTESSDSWSQGIVERNMRTLAAAGVTFSLDDYGTGYSNISRALALPFSLVKLDKSLVDDMDTDIGVGVISHSVDMLHEAGRAVLAEGVETREQLSALRARGVDYIQGYYFAKPLPEDEFVAFLYEHNRRA